MPVAILGVMKEVSKSAFFIFVFLNLYLLIGCGSSEGTSENIAATNQNEDLGVSLEPEQGFLEMIVQIAGPGKVQINPGGIVCGEGEAQCSVFVLPGTQISLEAVADPNEEDIQREFHKWGGACSGINQQECELTVDEWMYTAANFSEFQGP